LIQTSRLYFHMFLSHVGCQLLVLIFGYISVGSCYCWVVGCRLSSADYRLSGATVGGCCWFLVVGCRLLVPGCRVSVVGFWLSGVGFQVLTVGCRVQLSEVVVCCWLQGVSCRVLFIGCLYRVSLSCSIVGAQLGVSMTIYVSRSINIFICTSVWFLSLFHSSLKNGGKIRDEKQY
jgi:hypothetical protein